MNIALSALKAFWVTVAVCLALMAMLRVNSLVHVWSPTPHKTETLEGTK